MVYVHKKSRTHGVYGSFIAVQPNQQHFFTKDWQSVH